MQSTLPLQLPSFQYSKLLKYKHTLGCTSDAELIGILTQTFLCTLAQPLSISSKEVDMLLSQGQSEPKIRSIMMALLVQFLTSHSTKDQEAKKPTVLQSQSPLLCTPPSSSHTALRIPEGTPLLNGRGLVIPQGTPLISSHLGTILSSNTSSTIARPTPILSNSSPLLSSLGNSNSSLNSFLSTSSNCQLSDTTPWLSTSTPVPSRPLISDHQTMSRSQSSLHPTISLSSILSTPPITSSGSEHTDTFRSLAQSVAAGSPEKSVSTTTTPRSTPQLQSSPKKQLQFNSAPVVTVLEDSSSGMKLEDERSTTHENSVQGPTANVSLDEMESVEMGVLSSPCSSERSDHTSPISSLLDNNEIDLNEVMKVLMSDGNSSTEDEVVSKLVRIINDLVETTEITMADIVEMMRSSVQSSSETCTQDQPAPASSSSSNMVTSSSTVTSSSEEQISSIRQHQVLTLDQEQQKLTGIILPANWLPLQGLKSTPPAPNTCNEKASHHHPYSRAVGDKKSNVCSTCNTTFSQFSSLLRHIRQVHQKIKDKPCTICGERFARSQYLPNHIWRSHYNRATGSVSCFFCPEILCGKEGIQQHLWLNHVKARR